jgi:hypothetical protein
MSFGFRGLKNFALYKELKIINSFLGINKFIHKLGAGHTQPVVDY